MRELSLEELDYVSGGVVALDPVLVTAPDPGTGVFGEGYNGGSTDTWYAPGGGGGANPGNVNTYNASTPSVATGLAKIKAALGVDLTAYANMSGFFASDIANTMSYGYNFAFASGQSATHVGAIGTYGQGVIDINSSYQGNVLAIVQQLSHEFSHAELPVQDNPLQVSSAQYVSDYLDGEGRATLNNETVRDEILHASGIDIGVASGSPTMRAQYDADYAKVKASPSLNYTEAHAIGQLIGANEQAGGVSYSQYYLNWYHAQGGTR